MLLRLRATVREVTGLTIHSIGTIKDGLPVATEILPPAEWVEISSDDESRGVSLFYFNKDGECFADGWHMTIDEAKRQANFEYGILSTDWQEVEAGSD